MTDIAIAVKNLSKIYELYDKPLDRLKESLHPLRKKYHKDFYALRDVSFEVQKGETVGIIGKNGSGKSTLLKILTGVLTPTSGNSITNGNISALLELGTGFNPEYTGIENIYFSGTIMGYSREDMDSKLDDILSFADIGDFVYQPVKVYSSGMFVRLAFAVAVSVDPDILIVDEALSVGDMRFQFKCLRKMEEFKERGKTFLFVTHGIDLIKNFCGRAIWLMDGSIYQDGDSKDVADKYAVYMNYDTISEHEKKDNPEKTDKHTDDQGGEFKEIKWEDVSHHPLIGEGGVKINKVAFYEINEYSKKFVRKVECLKGNEKLVFLADVDIKTDVRSPIAAIHVSNDLGNIILGINSFFADVKIAPMHQNERVLFRFEFKLPKLKNGNYTISIGIADGQYKTHIQHQAIHDVYFFKVLSDNLAANHYYLVVDDAYVYSDVIASTIREIDGRV